MAAKKGAKQQASEVVFGSTHGKHKSQADAQIQREIARLAAQGRT